MVCRQLNMEESVAEIMHQLGADENGKISFQDFSQCRMELVREIRKEEVELSVKSDDSYKKKKLRDRIASWPTSSNNSLGALSGARESWEYDSGARDLQSPDLQSHFTLQKVLENGGSSGTQQAALQKLLSQASNFNSSVGGSYLELANTLHLAALASLKGDIVELNKRLQQTERERDLLEKKLAKAQCEQSHLMREHEDVQERTTLRYEERITELHSIIAELNKKIDRLQGTTIREEDEYSEMRSELSQSQHEVNEDSRSMDQNSVSVPENQSTMVTADMDNCSDLNSELQRVLTGLENVVCGRKKSSCSLSVAEVDRHIEQLTTASEHCDLAIKTVEEIEGVLGRDLYPNLSEERSRWEKELAGLREENESLTAMLCSKEEELNRTKATMNAIREERDRLRRRVRELQTRLQSVQATGPSSPSRLTSANRPINPSTGELSTSSSSNDIPIAKIAERVKLSKTRSESSSSDRPVLGSEISSIGVSSTVAEHLAHSLQDCSNIQEIFQTLYSHGSAISESKIREFEVETERLNSRIEHLKSQNDLLTITLEECKSNAERMSMLVGKYESNATALRLALQYSEQCIEAYELLLALAESEQSLILGQFRAAGVGSVGDQTGDENITQMLKRAHDCRKTAENAAKALLMKLDGSCGGAYAITGCSVQPWESLSSNSHTSTTSSTASSCDTEFTKEDEQRLKDYIQQLKNDRAAVKLTMLELESIHIDPLSYDVKPRGDSQRLDLENAVLMQELMAMKEEMAELKAQLYLLEKEKKALELKLSTREAQEQAYLVHIEHLKSEVEEQKEQRMRSLSSTSSGSKDKLGKECSDGTATPLTLAELRPYNESELTAELTNALRREKKLKARVQELVSALERLTKSSEIRHQQSAEFVNDLKRANSNLVAAYEKAKKKHQNKLKKLESQMMAMVERHETQVRMLKQRIALLEEENSRPHTNETSL
ncbi:colorectal mutant cancer protein isoform X4 [Cygnus olor]|nr:colorectal mutant cancer protein isoform X4 [Cygnus atratus]XP_040397616.1 colorectal mutant cancer protein isoform X4 [Cygnus olor]XP_040397617.1 colorectal mutant cancer protein isoform X4 [Cygnus olor]XP_040397618.1 colorectal mutant cancer protein isoform X4 [Cygnus olor]XP_040397622.1 colorectal mutant cancer protein isoform X4 [Cygnus olor]XP_050572419.1 colorectal mutant cancer protein isoform X4 [Cygnus atratus]XP_050572420.1 colorectal mutant cancer protein isoform X4 [Cygnus atra